MRNLLLLIGAPGAGKSTWVIENGLQEYTLGTDNIRTLYGSIKYKIDGTHSISQDYDGNAWDMLIKFLTHRMRNGEFTIVDAPHTKLAHYEKYKRLADKYNYNVYGKIFNPHIDVLVKQNIQRPPYKHVPEGKVREHYDNLNNLEVPEWVGVINEIYQLDEIIKFPNLPYRNIYFIGGIHGTIQGLSRFIVNEYNEQDLFVFLGGYLDRGNDNDAVMNLLLSLKGNTVFLEGSHEKALRHWANDEKRMINSEEFFQKTYPQLEKNVDKQAVKAFCDKLQLYFSATFKNKRLFACYGGVPRAQVNFISAKQLIHGVGEYSNLEGLYENVLKRNFTLIHAHRNLQDYPTKVEDNIYNLEGKPEYGGYLRVVKMRKGREPKILLY